MSCSTPPARRGARRSPRSSAGRCIEPRRRLMSAAAGNYRLGIDIGGTFTDFCLMHEATGKLMSVKVPSTPSHPTKRVLEGIKVYGERYQGSGQGVSYSGHGITMAV